jgi:hypothetical protein
MSFEYAVSADSSGNVIISFLPETNGMEGDGYVISYFDNNPYISLYFLPEGNSLILPNDKYYHFMIGRAYKTKKGMVVGNYQDFRVNLGQKEILVEDLNLKKLDEIYSYIAKVNIVANYPKKNLHIFPFQFPDYTKESYPHHYDWVEVELKGVGKGVTTKYREVDGNQGGYVKLPKNKGMDNQYCKAYPVIVDMENNREIIENSAPRIEFRSKKYPQ